MISGCSVEDALPTTEDVLIRAVFKLHEVFHEPLRSSWIKFLNVGITSMKIVFVGFKHFDDIHLNKEDKRIRLNMHLNHGVLYYRPLHSDNWGLILVLIEINRAYIILFSTNCHQFTVK